MTKTSIIGSGYIGSLTGKGLKDGGNTVIFYDIDQNRINELKSEGHDSTTDLEYAVKNSDIFFICVPTPTKNGKIDLVYIKSAIESLSRQIKNKKSYHLIVIKSTIVPKTTETIIIPLVEKFSGKKCGRDFGICTNPEFLTQMNKVVKDPEMKLWYASNPTAKKTFDDKAVIGEYDKKSGDMLESVFKKMNIPTYRTDLKTAEMIKYAHNLNLATRISYWNEIFLICSELGIDSSIVAQIVSTDSRIGKYGIVHGKAFGGACLPKDLEAFIEFAKENKINPELLKAVQNINKKMKEKSGVRE